VRELSATLWGALRLALPLKNIALFSAILFSFLVNQWEKLIRKYFKFKVSKVKIIRISIQTSWIKNKKITITSYYNLFLLWKTIYFFPIIVRKITENNEQPANIIYI
jgi:hypothetical protein